MTDTEIIDHLLELDDVGMTKCFMGNPHICIALAKSLRATRKINKILQRQISQSPSFSNDDLVDALDAFLNNSLTLFEARCSMDDPAKINAETVINALVSWHQLRKGV